MKIDDIDLKILQIISVDPRISYRNISKKVNITTPTVIERIKRMEKTGIIRGYFTDVNFEHLNQYKEIFLLCIKDVLPEDLMQNQYVKK
ncbi:MAG: Lrp/AsnC family transcriptional regulator [Thermoplasmata archaeon]